MTKDNKNEIKLTDQQLKVIEESLDGSWFVTAGAGSGKTETVMRRFVEALRQNKAEVSEILTITFTEKAAGEMARRVRKLLGKFGMTEERRMIEQARISTIHSFCSSLIRKYSLALGIDPNFSVADQPQSDIIMEESFNICLDRLLERHGEEVIELKLSYDSPREPLFQHVKGFYNAGRSRGSVSPSFKVPVPDRIDLAAREASLRESLRLARLANESSSFNANKAMEKLDDLDGGLGEKDLDRLIANLCENKPIKSGVKDEGVKAIIDEALAAHEDYLRDIYSLKAIPMLRLIHELLNDFAEEYAANKRARGLLDFEDLQLMAYQLLREHKKIRHSVANSYKYIMVDEFQDTNKLQCDLIELLGKNNIMTVGDGNQSIYRFRNADVSLFQRWNTKASRVDRCLPLNENFRSQKELLTFIDFLFSRDDMLGLHGYSSLKPSAKRDPDREKCRTEVIFVDSSNAKDESYSAADNSRMAEAQLIAKRLYDLEKRGRFKFGDMTILLRKKKHAEKYREALDRMLIPNYLSVGRDYFKKVELGEALSMLRLLVNPDDDLALLAVLRSPMVQLSDDALFLLRDHTGGGRGAKARPLWPEIASGRKADFIDHEEWSRLASFASEFEDMRNRARRQSLEAIVRDVNDFRDYAALVAARRGGSRAYANLLKLRNLAADFESAWGRDLAEFVNFLETRRQTETDEGDAPTEEEKTGSVRIMTIHSAKGLEFPLVVWADMGSSVKEKTPLLRTDGEGKTGFRYKPLGSSDAIRLFDYDELAAIEEELGLEEEKRIGYVAMTRAKNHLILCGTSNFETESGGMGSRMPIDWLRSLLLEDGRTAKAALFHHKDSEVRLTVCMNPLEVLAAGKKPTMKQTIPEIDPVAPWVNESFEPSSFVPAKVSPTALDTFEECQMRFYIENVLHAGDLFEFTTEEQGPGEHALSAKDMGTLVHGVLETDLPIPGAESITKDLLHQRALQTLGSRTHLKDADLELALRLITNLRNTDVSSEIFMAAAAGTLQRELPFTTLVGNTIVGGKIDAMFHSEDGTTVVDYKTGALSEGCSLDDAADKYKHQMAAYALAAGRMHAGPIKVVLVFLDGDGQQYASSYEAHDLPALKQQLESVIGRMASGRFDPLEKISGRLCYSCGAGPNGGRLCLATGGKTS